jgi:cytochrome c oxidase subunit 3
LRGDYLERKNSSGIFKSGGELFPHLGRQMATTLSHTSKKPVPGGGNRWPLPPQAFGGGDGGGGGGRGDGDGLHDFRQQLRRYRLGLLFTAGSIVMLFISFTTLFVARRAAGRFNPMSGDFQSDWIPVPLPIKILLVNTAVLAVSSLLIEIARRAARLEAVLSPMGRIAGVRAERQTSLLWVWAAVVSGWGFLFGQVYAWQRLHLKGVELVSGPASAFYYLLTGTHALHLAAGMVVLLYVCLAPGPRRSLERRCITLDVTARYWHFMAIMWVYVLLVLKLMNS